MIAKSHTASIGLDKHCNHPNRSQQRKLIGRSGTEKTTTGQFVQTPPRCIQLRSLTASSCLCFQLWLFSEHVACTRHTRCMFTSLLGVRQILRAVRPHSIFLAVFSNMTLFSHEVHAHFQAGKASDRTWSSVRGSPVAMLPSGFSSPTSWLCPIKTTRGVDRNDRA